MADEEPKFVATGPAGEGIDPMHAAFLVGWTDPGYPYGANLQGDACGLFASAGHGGNRGVPSNVPIGVGVCATGGKTGVYGESQAGGFGVRGESHQTVSGAGVCGMGVGRGVIGVSRPSNGDRDDFRVGVLGLVDESLIPKSRAVAEEAGDSGIAGVASPDGIGVLGSSYSGPAVEGRAQGGPGGRFGSATGPQVNLRLDLREPPLEGEAGDLLATADDPDSPVPEASLWFCTRRHVPGRPAVWKQLA